MRLRAIFLPILALLLLEAAVCQNSAPIQLVGVGTSSALPVYLKWFQEFEKLRPDIHLTYIPSGSETGIDMIASSTADFGATDVPLSDKQLAKAGIVQITTVLGAIIPVYNLPGITRPLKFSPRALAGIYLGTITKWDDPAISDLNPNVPLPSSTILVVHSADGRGSTYIWSDYLSKVSPEWRSRVGRGLEITWPIGKEAEGNGNVARLIKETPDSIGYVQLIYALQNALPHGLMQNAAGNFVGAYPLTMVAAAETAAGKIAGFRASITNAPGASSYPISSFIWILFSPRTKSPAKRQALKDFLRWALTEGQNYVESDGFAKLPKALAEEELKTIDEIR
jgi:phosphate transport system substrate-binding protein